MKEEKLHTTKEVAEILGIKPHSVIHYHNKYGIGKKKNPEKITDPGLYTDADIFKIQRTDGRCR